MFKVSIKSRTRRYIVPVESWNTFKPAVGLPKDLDASCFPGNIIWDSSLYFIALKATQAHLFHYFILCQFSEKRKDGSLKTLFLNCVIKNWIYPKILNYIFLILWFSNNFNVFYLKNLNFEALIEMSEKNLYILLFYWAISMEWIFYSMVKTGKSNALLIVCTLLCVYLYLFLNR